MNTQNETVTANTVTVIKPTGITGEAYAIEPGTRIVLSDEINLSQTIMSLSGQNLVITPEGSADILLLGFIESAQSDVPPIFVLADGSEFSANAILNQVESTMVATADGTTGFMADIDALIEPAAGNAGDTGENGDGFTPPAATVATYAAGPTISDVIAGIGIGHAFPSYFEEDHPRQQAAVTDKPRIQEPTPLNVDETNFASAVLLQASGTLQADFGTSTPGTFAATDPSSFAISGSVASTLTSNGNPVVVTLTGNTYTGTANGVTVFTLSIASNGDYLYQQFEAMDHADGTNPDDVFTLDFGFKAINASGEEAEGTLAVNVEDDAPTANDDLNDFNGLSATGNVITGVNGGATAADEAGADQPATVSSVTFGATTVAVVAGTATTINGDDGVLTINSDGSYTYDLFAPATTTYTLSPSATDAAGTQNAITLNGIVISTLDPSHDISWAVTDGPDGLGVTGGGTDKVYKNGEGFNVNFDADVETITFTIGDIGSNNINGPIDLTAYFTDGTSHTIEVFVGTPTNFTSEITVTAADFGMDGKLFDSVDVYSDAGVGASGTQISFTLVDVEGTTAEECHLADDVFTYTIIDVDGDEAAATLSFQQECINEPPVVTVNYDCHQYTSLVKEFIEHELDPNTPLFPILVEGQAINLPGNGVNRDNLTLENDHEVSINFIQEGAGYKNTLGAYFVQTDGTITDVQMLSLNTSASGSGGTYNMGDLMASLGELPAGTEVEFFIVANGYNENGAYSSFDFNNDTLEFRNAAGDIAKVTDDGPLTLVLTDGQNEQVIDGRTYHTVEPNLNFDDQIHAVSGVNQDGNLQIGFEDLPNLGDSDFEDLIFEVVIEPACILTLEPVNVGPNVTVTDVDSVMMSSGTVVLTSYLAGDVLALAAGLVLSAGNVVAGTNITFTYDEVTHTATLNGDDTIANYEMVFQAIQLSSTAAHPESGTREVEFNVTDNTGLASNIATELVIVTGLPIEGDNHSNTLYGDAENNLILGHDGKDILKGKDGDDVLKGGNGHDVLKGGAGNDILVGGAGHDILYGDEAGTAYQFTQSGGYNGAGNIEGLSGSYNPNAQTLSFRLEISEANSTLANGFTLALNNGANPKGHAGEMPLFYFDASGSQAVLTAYAYNGLNSATTFMDGSAVGGVQTPDTIASSLTTDGWIQQLKVTTLANGNKVFEFEVNTDILNGHNPLYPDAVDPWNGVDFSSSVGIWLHPFANVETAYDDEGYLTQWDYTAEGWHDSTNTNTTEVRSEGTAGNDCLHGGSGHDILYGGAGNDYLNGGESADKLYGGSGNDTLDYDAQDAVIDGGTGYDTLKIMTNTQPLNLGSMNVQRIEHIDMANDEFNELSLNVSDVVTSSDINNTMKISGDDGDAVNAQEFSERGDDVAQNGKTYAQFTDTGNSATLLVELGLQLNGVTVDES